jgi:flavin reductase (DIM6/NTAB) family NADH-FMN oxidoreductase RutF
MDYVDVPFTTYFEQTMALLQRPGALLVTETAEKANAMTIGWATIGIVWGRKIMTVMVRPSRYTYSMIEQSDSFTVCLPAADMAQAVSYCGAYSGRDGDKLAACNLTTLPSTRIKAPGLAGCPVIYECRIVHTNAVTPETLSRDIASYPQGDYHRIYWGEILAVRALPNAAELLAPKPLAAAPGDE